MTACVAVIILAAGRGSRFDPSGRAAKVVAPLHGVPLVRTVAITALASRAISVMAVTGPAHAEVAAALDGLPVQIVHNTGFATGLASSLQAGLRQLTADIDAILVMLADMPLVQASTLEHLMLRFERAPDAIDAVAPIHDGRRGNPILIGRRLFARIKRQTGDVGARRLLSMPGVVIEHCEVADPGVTIDIDTLADLAALRQSE